MNFDLPIGLCPKCKADGVELYATWAQNGKEVICSRGHSFYDHNDFNRSITKPERKKIEKESNKTMNKLLNQETVRGESFDPEKGEAGVDGFPVHVPAIEQRQDGDIVLNDVDKARLESILGEFNDASTLVGRVFAMNEEKKDIQNLIKNAKKVKAGEEDGKITAGGDLEIKAYIPERHVQPLMDMAHGWSTGTTRYFNERLTSLLDDMLFY